MLDQPAQRDLVHHAVTKRRNEWQPETAEARSQAGRFGKAGNRGNHGPSPDWPETGHKKPHLAAGVLRSGVGSEIYRAHRSKAPEREAFFMTAWRAHKFVNMRGMMRRVGSAVNGMNAFLMMKKHRRLGRNRQRKKPGS